MRLTIAVRTEFLLTCLLRGMTDNPDAGDKDKQISTHMPLARHDNEFIG